jgi:hypothetical protein
VEHGFETNFQFQIVDRDPIFSGADGFAFVIQNSPAGVTALGGTGGNLGYSGIPNSLAIEFDTYQNLEFSDADANHVSVHSGGDLRELAALGRTSVIPTLDDDQIHTARVVYLPGTLSIYLDSNSAPTLTVPVDLGSLLTLNQGQAFLGFTAATGGGYENHDILSWTYVELSTEDRASGAIRGVAFDDFDGDASHDVGEPGLAGWTIYLDGNGNGQLDSGELSTTTGADGSYTFTDLSPGTYRVAEVLKAGWVQTAPAARTYEVTLTSGEIETGLDFGNLRLTLDVDGNGAADALSDGIVIIRYLFGFTGEPLISGVVDPGGSRNTAAAVESYLDQAKSTMLDVDGNGQADALSDGILIVRYLFGFTGDALINGAVDSAGTRNTAAAVETFLSGFLPVSSPTAQAQSLVASEPVTSSAITTMTTTTASDSPAPSVSLVEMESDTMTRTVTEINYGLAYVQQSWVKEFVTTKADVIADDEELLIQLA